MDDEDEQHEAGKPELRESWNWTTSPYRELSELFRDTFEIISRLCSVVSHKWKSLLFRIFSPRQHGIIRSVKYWSDLNYLECKFEKQSMRKRVRIYEVESFSSLERVNCEEWKP